MSLVPGKNALVWRMVEPSSSAFMFYDLRYRGKGDTEVGTEER